MSGKTQNPVTETGEEVVHINEEYCEIVVDDGNGNYALYVMNNDFQGNTIVFNGNAYEFVSGFVDKYGEPLGSNN